MNCKKQLKSKVFYEDGHVHNVKVSATDEASHCYVKAKVLPSMPTANQRDSPDYDVWVMLSKMTGCVNSAECNCTAGDGEACNHIAALLYAIADITEKKQEGKLAPTSQKCKWNNPRKRKLSPKKAQDVQFKKYSYEKQESTRKCIKLFDVNVQQNSTVNIQRFRNRLISDGLQAGWLTNFVKEDSTTKKNEPVQLPLLHKSILYNYSDKVDLRSEQCIDAFEQYLSTLSVNEEECFTIELITRDQSKSSNWQRAREERITASNFGKIVKRKDFHKPEALIKDVWGYRTFDNDSVQYGRTHEAAARRMYVKRAKFRHSGIQVKLCGLLVDPAYPHLGASPDGLVYCTCSECKPLGHGLLEIKCPASMKWRMSSPEECAKDPKFYCNLDENGHIKLKENHPYYFQVQGQMAIANRKWCDFVVWTCTGISIQRITFNKEVWDDMLKKLNECFLKVFIPELFSKRVYRGRNLF